MRFSICAAAMLTAASLSAQSPLTTLFTSNNSGAAGWTMYFDVTVNVPLTFTQFDINNISGAVAGSLNVYYTTSATTYVGNDTNVGAWTLGGTGTCTGAATNTPTTCPISPFTLPVGSYGMAIVHTGVGPAYTNGNGTSVPGSGTNQTYSTAELTLRAGASAGGGLGTAICCTPRVINCNIYYNISGSGTVATRTPYGAGCYTAADQSFYENFATAAAFDLSNSSMSILNTGSGYFCLPGITTFRPTTTAVALALTDDSETTVALTAPFKYGRTGTTNSLTVCSNGFVSVASGNGTGFSPVVSSMLAGPQTGWWGWHDYNPSAVGSGQVKFEETGGVAYVTWDGVYDFGGSTAANASTVQMQFEEATGNVHMIWQTMSVLGNGFLVGFSEGGASADPGNRDISATLPGTFGGNFALSPLALAASARPLIGTSINLVTSNIPAGTALGASLLGLVQFNPGIDLTAIGMPGCSKYTDGSVTQIFLVGGSTANVAFNIPNVPAYIGIHVFAESATFSAGFNALGVIASNGLDLGIGNL
jgi:hypothetical protein